MGDPLCSHGQQTPHKRVGHRINRALCPPPINREEKLHRTPLFFEVALIVVVFPPVEHVMLDKTYQAFIALTTVLLFIAPCLPMRACYVQVSSLRLDGVKKLLCAASRPRSATGCWRFRPPNTSGTAVVIHKSQTYCCITPLAICNCCNMKDILGYRRMEAHAAAFPNRECISAVHMTDICPSLLHLF